MRAYVGIDVGITGALAMVDREARLQAVVDMPIMSAGKRNQIDAAALSRLLREWANGEGDELLVTVERQRAMPAQGVGSVFSLGVSFGIVLGVVAARGYTVQLVEPAVWKRALKLGADKEQARARAIQMFPEAELGRKRDHGRAEACLIAAWACRDDQVGVPF